ncbi:hypothetical protein [Tenacibaculum xiamenense]|uniref:hypothetical protein n=1 Tax=Tenacibaculum xiamenense TaxID=1261553 RepID=UPI003895751C
MSNIDFKIGDKIFHKSESRVTWIIESIENGEATCSTVIKETLEQKRQKFKLASIEKCGAETFRIGSTKRRNNHF